MLFTAVTFIAFTALVAVIAWWRTRDDDLSTQDGYFLAGRSLTGPVIAGSLMLTNLSTEQLIGQTGQSFSTNMGPIAWEVTSAAALVILALVFLPRYLKMGLTTVPEFLENRYDSTTKRIVSIMFLLGYLLTYLPTVLYSGALVFNQIFEVDKRMGVSQMQGVIITAVAIGIVGACYAIFGGLKAVAVSDTINGIGLIIGGFMIPIFGLLLLGNDNFLAGRTGRKVQRHQSGPRNGADDSMAGALYRHGRQQYVLLVHQSGDHSTNAGCKEPVRSTARCNLCRLPQVLRPVLHHHLRPDLLPYVDGSR